MQITDTPIADLKIISPDVFADKRGFFTELYNEERYQSFGIKNKFVQDNLSKSCYGVVRGLHFQKGSSAQAKLVQVIMGKVWDVAVDLRPGSSTYGQWYGVELSGDNHLQYLIPRGFAHGFLVLSPEAVFTYKVDNTYVPESEASLQWNDPQVAIEWPINPEEVILSEKDLKKALPLSEAEVFE